MTLADGLAGRLTARLARGREAAEARMGWSNGNHASDAVVKREDPDNPQVVDGLEVPSWTIVHQLLVGRLDGSDGTRTITIGQTEVQVAVRVWKCPAGTSDLIEGDVLQITAGENAGIFLRVVEAAWEDQAIQRRVPVVETQEPEGWSA